MPSRDAVASVEVFCFFLFEEKNLVIIILVMILAGSIDKDINDQQDSKDDDDEMGDGDEGRR